MVELNLVKCTQPSRIDLLARANFVIPPKHAPVSDQLDEFLRCEVCCNGEPVQLDRIECIPPNRGGLVQCDQFLFDSICGIARPTIDCGQVLIGATGPCGVMIAASRPDGNGRFTCPLVRCETIDYLHHHQQTIVDMIGPIDKGWSVWPCMRGQCAESTRTIL